VFNQSDAHKPVIVVLAVPYPAVADVRQARRAARRQDRRRHHEPVELRDLRPLTVPADGSAAAEIAEALPQSRMLKALNTQLPTTVLIAGDDAEAKALLAGVSYRWWLCAPSTPARLGGPRWLVFFVSTGTLDRIFAFARRVMWSDDCSSSTCGHLSRF
jgi:hypothetical protein